MNELTLQDKFLIPFFVNTLGYHEVKANTVTNSLIIEEDLQRFIAETSLNEKAYTALLKKYGGDGDALLKDLIALIQERSASNRNMALFINSNKSVSLQGVQLQLFHPSGSVVHEDKLFKENIFSVVQELPYIYEFSGKTIFSFRPDISVFMNGIFLGYSELKANYTNQTAKKNGRNKVIKDYFDAVKTYYEVFDRNAALTDKEKEHHRKDFLKIFERAIHITTTDINETYVIRNISDFFTEVLETCRSGRFDRDAYEEQVRRVFKPYPLLLKPDASYQDKLKEIFTAHYGKTFVEKEILYYNFIERDIKVFGKDKEVKDEAGMLVSPRPKQKFGTDKIIAKIDEFLEHENDDDYFIDLLKKQLAGVSAARQKELIDKRLSYKNNKDIYSLLVQYAAGFGKSNIIGWTALQLKDLRRDKAFIYDKIMLVVDRIQLREQLDSKMLNMNIERGLYTQAYNKRTFLEALAGDKRIVIVNLQKFGAAKEMIDDEVLARLSKMRIAFLIDEIHRSNAGAQHEEMINVFDELQVTFDRESYNQKRNKKNLIIGFTATPDDLSLARFGEFSGYAESEKIWVPFDSYTMKEAIEDGYIHNPLLNIVPVASKMLFAQPTNKLRGFEEAKYKDVDKKQIYENRDRIDAISAYIADLLVKDVYNRIRGTAKAMLAVYSIKAAIAYKDRITHHFNDLVKEKKYAKYADAPIHIVYSNNQDEQKASSMNDGLSEEKVMENFSLKKNGLIIVVDKLQTGFDEKRLHTLFLDKEIRGISAIQTISRVNRTTKYKNECRIVDFSYDNVNVQNIKDAFEHFSDVVVSDFDPHSHKLLLEQLYSEMKKSGVYAKFFNLFMDIYKDKTKRDDPENYLNFEQSLEKFIHANPETTLDTKAKAAQYFTILNRIEYTITLEAKYSEDSFLFFWRKFNQLYNLLTRSSDSADPIEVYFDNKIGIIEKKTVETTPKEKKPPKMATGGGGGGGEGFDVLAIIEARNQHEEIVGKLIEEFKDKIQELFDFIKTQRDGERLVVKIRSHVSEDEIRDSFAKLYRTYRAVHRKRVGEHFFKETEDLVDKLSDDFSRVVLSEQKSGASGGIQ